MIIPYGRHNLSSDDEQAVIKALRSGWLTTGPLVTAFELELGKRFNAPHVAALSNGTAALHAAMFALGIGPGDEVVTPSISFAATANCVAYVGAKPVFAEVDPDTLLVTPETVEQAITPNTRAIIVMDYGGQPCEYDLLASLASKRGVALIADACHSVGAEYKGRPVGSLADVTVFSFHPVKNMTTCEGGAVLTANADWEARIRMFRNHGIDSDFRQREKAVSYDYDMVDLGFNYRLSDLHSALGISQLSKLDSWVEERNRLDSQYNNILADVPWVTPLSDLEERLHARHLKVVRIDSKDASRDRIFHDLRKVGLGVNVHYKPIYLHTYYKKAYGYEPGLCPLAEEAYSKILTLPLFPGLTSQQVEYVCECLIAAGEGHSVFPAAPSGSN